MKRILLCVAASLWLAACSTTTTMESRPSDQPGRVDAQYKAQIHTDLAAEYYRLGSYKAALDTVQLAIAAVPTYAPAYNMKGLVHMALGQDEQARQAFEQALKVAPKDSESLNNYGGFLCQHGDAKRAMEYFQQALANPLYNTPERALYNAGMCAKKTGDNSAAEDYFRGAVQRQSQFAPPLIELADIEFQRGRGKEAEARLQAYNALVPLPGPEALYLGARIARANNDRTAEASYAQQLRRRFPEAPQTRLIGDR
ncbi:MAG: type IV pilus biogenesis/stability protein PilW [Betaproteobacteria bacterium]|nr:type IV pilus biogenesis/stability protein PilW [Betaproteobacteria bacterium]